MTSYTKGHRVRRRTLPRYTAKPSGKREESPVKAPRRGMIRLTVCAALLASLVAVKLLCPEVLTPVRETLLRLMGEETDFVAVFSSLGRVMGGDVEEALNDAYIAVFGQQPVEDSPAAPPAAEDAPVSPRIAYTPENTPSQAQLLQEVLGFAYETPVEGTLSDGFGYRQHPVSGVEKFHYGLDIAAEEGSVISAFAAGQVTALGDNSELGQYVEVAHANGYSTLYAHCSRITASVGQTVAPGDPIAEVGQTGRSTGPHLHFELHRNTVYLDPIYYVSFS